MKLLVLTVINLLFNILYLLFVVRALIPYLPHNRTDRFLRPIYDLTEGSLSWIKRGLPPAAIGFDASAFIAIVLLYLLQQLIIRTVSII
jgi:uncharacterized protein YggT (Ycf19 family)